jgi:hypothetical protein
MNGNAEYTLDIWWVADCGYLHVERDPVTVPWHCPDDYEPDEQDDPEPPR